MVISEFTFASSPEIVFGPGTFHSLPRQIETFGKRALIVTGKKSFATSGRWNYLTTALKKEKVTFFHTTVSGEPSPALIDAAVRDFKTKKPDVIVAIGGGSVIDAGKTISAMILKNESVLDYLEGIGNKMHNGSKIPFIAVPTTAGTGSEATKNAVISRIGKNGFKKSLRHNRFIPDIALIDPELHLSCPPEVTAACGLDAFSQLLESYVSTKANPITDVLAINGLKKLIRSLPDAFDSGSTDISARTEMAYAALLSGITLANAGLGIIHGLAGPIGGLFPIPHGVVCGRLLGEATRQNIKNLKRNQETTTLKKYARVGQIFANQNKTDTSDFCQILIDKIEKWIARFQIPKLGTYGVSISDIDKITERTGIKNNPIKLNTRTIKDILQKCI